MGALRRLLGTMPETSCPTCWMAEASPFWRGAMAVGLIGTDPYAAMTRSLGLVASAVLGGPATWYDRHRLEFEQTGDELEMRRMLRHIYEKDGNG